MDPMVQSAALPTAKDPAPAPPSSAFELASLQLVLFTPDYEFSAARLTKAFLPKWGDFFDAQPIMLPGPTGFPFDMPQVILTSKAGYRCEIGAGRIAMTWSRQAFDSPPPSVQKVVSEATNVLTSYKDASGQRVGRLACVASRFTRHPTPALCLARHFCKSSWDEAPLNRPESFEVHAHKRYRLGQFMVNSWVRNKSGVLTAGGPSPVILAEQDVNTLSEDAGSRDSSREEIRDYFESLLPELDQILALYYPGQSR